MTLAHRHKTVDSRHTLNSIHLSAHQIDMVLLNTTILVEHKFPMICIICVCIFFVYKFSAERNHICRTTFHTNANIQEGEQGLSSLKCDQSNNFFSTFVSIIYAGKGGSKIKEIRESTGCSIQVASDMLPNSTEREVKLTGTAEQITQCIFHICCVMLEVRFRTMIQPLNLRVYCKCQKSAIQLQ